ncbi:MAG: hypothetical protein ACI4RU_00540 [Acutalibacteraceae bacterium]
MIKGVNHQVVEVNDTSCEYFERIIFFVKPEYSFLSEGKIRERAGKIASTATLPPAGKTRRRKQVMDIIKIVSALLVGAGITALIFILK